MSDNWIEIVETLQPYIENNSTEAEYQREIETCLKYLGWRKSNGTLQSQVSLNIGNKNSIRPDIVLYKNDYPVLPIEIKRPGNSCNIYQESQLSSYMRQLRLNVGLYIGENIQIFYDNPNDKDNPVSIFKIDIKSDDANGDVFCEILTYNNFELDNLEDFCVDRYNQIKACNSLQQRLSEFLLESNVNKNIKLLIKEKLEREGFSEDVIENELNEYRFEVYKNRPVSNADKVEYKSDNNHKSDKYNEEFSLNGVNYFKVGPFVLEVVKKYILDHPTVNYDELQKRFPADLCTGTFGVVRDIHEIEEKKLKKSYFHKSEQIITLTDSTNIVVCREWGNNGNSRKYFQNFLNHVKTFYKVYSRPK